MKVSLFVTCLVDQLFPRVGISVVELLENLGVEVQFDGRQTCCGQPAFNSGYGTEARRVAENFLNVFADAEWIVTPSGSCATMVKHYLPVLFEEQPSRRDLAVEIGQRTRELSDFVVNVLGTTETGASFPELVTFHDSCHQLRELGICTQPRQLIRSVKGIRFVEMNQSTQCCGFGGTFSVKFPEISAALGKDKVEAIVRSGAGYVIANDVSCLMHIDGILRRAGHSVRIMHLAELLVQRR